MEQDGNSFLLNKPDFNIDFLCFVEHLNFIGYVRITILQFLGCSIES